MMVQQTLSGGAIAPAPSGRPPQMAPDDSHGGAHSGGGRSMSKSEAGGIVQRPYNQEKGFGVFWDYLLRLPKKRGGKVVGNSRSGVACGG